MEASVDRWGPGAQTIWLSILNSYKFTQAPGKHTRSRSPLPSPHTARDLIVGLLTLIHT
jgi:hypothetical protein